MNTNSYWSTVLERFSRSRFGKLAVVVVLLFILVAIYAPFLASSKPLAVNYDGQWYFPLFRYLFYTGFFTKHLDIFFNIMIFTIPIVIFTFKTPFRIAGILCAFFIQTVTFLYLLLFPIHDPAFSPHKNLSRFTWDDELAVMSPYARLNMILRYEHRQKQYENLPEAAKGTHATLWELDKENQQNEIARLQKELPNPNAKAQLQYILDKQHWIESQLPLIKHEIMPLIRPFHWEDDAGGNQTLNSKVPFWDLTRINRKDLVAALIFGTRISLVVGILAVLLALAIGLPLGSISGYYGGTFDIVVCRLMEVWEAMPTLFVLLTVVAIVQSKSIFLIIAVIGLFGWISICRYMRGEFLKQRNLSYIEACRAIGLPNRTIIFSHILPNAIPPILTLLPFDIMGAITAEAGLSFLGLGEEGSCSWGVLMDEGRTAFPYESYLLWPPAVLLTILLVAIALVGDNLRDAIDPKLE